MGAGGSVVTNTDADGNAITSPEVLPPNKAPSKTTESPNLKSKFPSANSATKKDPILTKGSSVPTFKVSVAFEIPSMRELIPLKSYLLRVSLESLDIVNEGV